MELSVFRQALKDLHKKSGMHAFLDWPFVYDEDEKGYIYVDPQSGIFYFADNLCNWVESPLLLSDVMNLRYEKAFEEPGIDNNRDEPSESSIYIRFISGNYIRLLNRHDTYSVDIDVHLHICESNSQMMDHLRTISSSHLWFTIT